MALAVVLLSGTALSVPVMAQEMPARDYRPSIHTRIMSPMLHGGSASPRLGSGRLCASRAAAILAQSREPEQWA
ncbi:hypothetical protein ACFSUK_12620 [Sphingobium scionense]